MSFNYTCRVCTKALRGESKILLLIRDGRAVATRAYSSRISTAGQFRSKTNSSHNNGNTQPGLRSSLNTSRSYASTTKPALPGDEIHVSRNIISSESPVASETNPDQSRQEAYDQKLAAAASGKRVGIEDKDGEVHILAQIPDDVRNYTWRSPEWTWGVLERLFQDCEQAKVSFELEEYLDERDEKTKKRVKRDANGLHIGHGTGWWFEELGLPQTFNTWALVCFLHMWILKVRIRQLPKKMSDHWSELLTNHFFWEAEKRMDLVHKMDGQDRKKNLDDFSQIWRGSILAYDEGLIKGDAVLATAIWRQLFDGDVNADPVKIALVTAYVRRELARIGWLEDRVIARGYVGFGEPVTDIDVPSQAFTQNESTTEKVATVAS